MMIVCVYNCHAIVNCFSFSMFAVVVVMFVNSTYSFSEGENGMIQLRLSTAIAQDVSISVNGGND